MAPISESSFLRRYFFAWVTLGATCVAVGLIVGPRINSTYNPWLSIVLGCAVYLCSLLLAQVVLHRIWRVPSVTSCVIFFAVAVGGMGLFAVILMEAIGPTYLLVPSQDFSGLAAAIMALYVAALGWALWVSIHRKKLENSR
ncbi:MAG TPA: hypothetical protein VMU28_11310 [Terriglobales bacterium]|nr:hypothetical protein [Terriglobales bacterium]